MAYWKSIGILSIVLWSAGWVASLFGPGSKGDGERGNACDCRRAHPLSPPLHSIRIGRKRERASRNTSLLNIERFASTGVAESRQATTETDPHR